MKGKAETIRPEDFIDWDQDQPLTATRLFEICGAPSQIEASFIDPSQPYVEGQGVRFRYDDEVLSGFVDWVALSEKSFLLIGETEMHQAVLTRANFGGYLSIAFTLSGNVRHGHEGGAAPEVNPPYCVISFYPDDFVRSVRYAKGSSNRSVGLYIFKSELEDCFHLPPELLPPPLREILQSTTPGLFFRYVPCPMQVATRFSDMTRSGLRHGLLAPYLRAKSGEMLCLAIDQLARSNDSSTTQTRLTMQELSRIQAVRGGLDRNLAAPLNLDRMCELAGMNRNKLADGFRYLFGMSPAEYSRQRRMEHSFRLLQSSTLPISRVAQEVGFSHTRNLASAFRKYFNVSPMDVRRTAPAGGNLKWPLSR